MTDPNGAKSLAAYDALGLVVATALQGHSGEGDLLDDVPIDLSTQQIYDYIDKPLTHGPALLGSATTRIIYDLYAFKRDRTPIVVSTFEKHQQHVHVQRQAPIQYSFLFSDGLGHAVQSEKCTFSLGLLQGGTRQDESSSTTARLAGRAPTPICVGWLRGGPSLTTKGNRSNSTNRSSPIFIHSNSTSGSELAQLSSTIR